MMIEIVRSLTFAASKKLIREALSMWVNMADPIKPYSFILKLCTIKTLELELFFGAKIENEAYQLPKDTKLYIYSLAKTFLLTN